MDELRQAVQLEFGLIEETLAQLPDPGRLQNLSELQLAGTAKFLSDIYTGFENVIKRIVQSRGLESPSGPSWHKELLDSAVENGIISSRTWDSASKLLIFRHLSTHAYGMRLSPDRLEPLVRLAPGAFESFKEDIECFL